ncbi:MAG: hypothetical protein ACPGVD_02245 [Flavobacteriales bacterium]
MKKPIQLITYLALLCFLYPNQGKSQARSSISIGLRSHFGGMQGINNIINQYNDSRDWLDNSLGNQRFQNGFEIGLQKSSEDFGFSMLKYFRVWNVSTAKGTTPSGEEFTRKLRTRVGGLELVDFWYTPIHIAGFNIGGGIMPMGGGIYRVHTKLDGEKWRKLFLSDLEANGEKGFFATYHAFSNFHIDVTREIGNNDLHIQFLYTRSWFNDEYNLIYVNNELNPSSFNSANYRQKHSQNNYGLKLILIL